MTIELQSLAQSRHDNDASSHVGHQLVADSYPRAQRAGFDKFYSDGYESQLEKLSLDCLVAGFLWNHMPISSLASTLAHPGSVRNFFFYSAERFPGATESMRTRSALSGIATAAAVVGADFLLDSTVFKNNYKGVACDVTDYALVPFMAFVPGNWALKGAAMVAAHSLACVLDERFFNPAA